MKEIRACGTCSGFSLEMKCPCGGETAGIVPQKYSPDEKYANLKRDAKEAARKASGLL